MVTLLLCMRCATESRLQLPLYSAPCLWLLQLATDFTSGASAAGYMMPEYGPQQDEDDYEEDPDFSGEDLALGGEPDETTLRRMLHGPPQQQDLALQYMRQRLNGGGCLSSLDQAGLSACGVTLFERQEVVLQCRQQRLDWGGCLPQQSSVCLHSNAVQMSTAGRRAAGPASV